MEPSDVDRGCAAYTYPRLSETRMRVSEKLAYVNRSVFRFGSKQARLRSAAHEPVSACAENSALD